MSESSASDEQRSDGLPTPDHLLHTGAEKPLDPEDLVRLSGREPTPERVEEARRLLEEHGPAAAERYLP
ncbi:hypothetical protein [Streptomyces sp. MP131-18]|uniref:hypothetical protein n=1 Tax=Streptomyces sp. MP131-18 TaxID=1857892 RepID=UPI00097C2438|nr:hypothetical protein [Streptomyces sp. MP131-18]ONK13721.1 hypothetical protein STBA_44940 [Streptomyces sp. MP131-18]